MTTLKHKNNLTTIAFTILTAFGGLSVSANSMAQTPAPATPVASAPIKPTVPQAPKQDYVVKELAKKQTPMGTPLAMTESYTAVVQDKEKAANSKNVGVISRSVEKTTTEVTTSTPVAPVVTTPANNVQAAAQPSVTATTTTTTVKETEKKPFDEKTITANVKPAEKSLKQINEINARLAEVELLQKLKEAEYKLQQPMEDKDKKGGPAGSGNGGSTLSAAGNLVAAPFNPVVRAGGANSGVGLPTGAPSIIPPPTNSNLNVYSVVGFDNDYTAKINIDGKSTYTVKKGDTLPDGQLVTDVTRYYIVVSERSAVGRPIGTQRIYVTGKPLTSGTAGRSATVVGGNASSASPQAQSVGMVGAGTTGPGTQQVMIPGQGSISSSRTVR